MSGAARYGALLRIPHVAALEAAATLARLPLGMTALALVLYVRDEGYGFAVAGAVAAAFGAGAAPSGPLLGRWVDRHGAARVLLPASLVNATALLAVVPLAAGGAHGALLIAAGLIAGFGCPPLSPVVRSLWGGLVPTELRQAAFALDAVIVEFAFVSGPLLVALFAATAGAVWGVVVAAVLVVVGTVAFCVQPPARGRGHGAASTAGWRGPLRSPGLVTVVLATVPLGACIGATEVAVPAFAEAQGNRDLAGVLLAAWALSSGAAGLWYGSRAGTGRPGRTWIALAVVAPLAFAIPLVAWSYLAMALLLAPAGAMIAPTITSATQVVEQVVEEGLLTEAYGWTISSLVTGIAAGQALAGVLNDGPGWQASIAAGVSMGLVGGAAALLRRGTLSTAPTG